MEWYAFFIKKALLLNLCKDVLSGEFCLKTDSFKNDVFILQIFFHSYPICTYDRNKCVIPVLFDYSFSYFKAIDSESIGAEKCWLSQPGWQHLSNVLLGAFFYSYRYPKIWGNFFSRSKSKILTENGLGNVLGDFFTNWFGHPGLNPRKSYLFLTSCRSCCWCGCRRGCGTRRHCCGHGRRCPDSVWPCLERFTRQFRPEFTDKT
jgi:hypothetical protein